MNETIKDRITSDLILQILLATILDLEEARRELRDPSHLRFPSPSECAWRHIERIMSAPLDALPETRETARSQHLVYGMANSLSEYVDLVLSLRRKEVD